MSVALSFGARPSRNWWLGVAIVVGAQFAAIFWLGDKAPVKPLRADAEPTFAMAPSLATGQNSEAARAKSALFWLEELNPTLFAWSGPRGFSGEAWLRNHRPANQTLEWKEAEQFLAPDFKQLSAQPITVEDGPTHPQMNSAPSRLADIQLPIAVWTTTALPNRSSVRVEGELATRQLLTPLAPPSQPANDLLPDTEVRVLVDQAGLVRSATILSGSGRLAADATALELARNARFAPLADRPLQTGSIVFRWHVVPAEPEPAARP